MDIDIAATETVPPLIGVARDGVGVTRSIPVGGDDEGSRKGRSQVIDEAVRDVGGELSIIETDRDHSIYCPGLVVEAYR